ncbi:MULTISPECIES: ABC transporter permease [unclassified Butyrivibrio]|uniref:ABC transporter permease n=1 Tax=unclassified Butyrivibrio TaxID=2639466 RepID=UPI0003B6B76D|nr:MULTISPECIES: ABC transporter permease [unclassified Butyrivibrio]SEM08789.1 peptide/nickel transport system permease protein [Butyrivibrio sp. ob235]
MKKFLSLFKKNKATGQRNTFLLLGTILTGIILLMVIVGVFYTPYSPTKMDASAKLQGISLKHIMGTDNMGRDVFSRVLYGSRITLIIATFTILIGAGVGTIIGALAGYFGGMFGEVTMRIIDAMLAFPSILLSLVFVSLFGTGTYQVAVALGISFVPSFARIVRGEFLRCRNMDYVEVARLQGVSNIRIIFVHILPNTVGVLLSSVMIGFNNAVLAEAGLSFLGIGAQPPYASLGKMLSDAQGYLFNRPSYVISIGLVIVLMVLGFSFLGEGIKRIQ